MARGPGSAAGIAACWASPILLASILHAPCGHSALCRLWWETPGCTPAAPRPLGNCSGLSTSLVCISVLIPSRFQLPKKPRRALHSRRFPRVSGGAKPTVPLCPQRSALAAVQESGAVPSWQRSLQRQPGSGRPPTLRSPAPSTASFPVSVSPSSPAGQPSLAAWLSPPPPAALRWPWASFATGLARVRGPCHPCATGVTSFVTLRGFWGFPGLAWEIVSWTAEASGMLSERAGWL